MMAPPSYSVVVCGRCSDSDLPTIIKIIIIIIVSGAGDGQAGGYGQRGWASVASRSLTADVV